MTRSSMLPLGIASLLAIWALLVRLSIAQPMGHGPWIALVAFLIAAMAVAGNLSAAGRTVLAIGGIAAIAGIIVKLQLVASDPGLATPFVLAGFVLAVLAGLTTRDR